MDKRISLGLLGQENPLSANSFLKVLPSHSTEALSMPFNSTASNPPPCFAHTSGLLFRTHNFLIIRFHSNTVSKGAFGSSGPTSLDGSCAARNRSRVTLSGAGRERVGSREALTWPMGQERHPWSIQMTSGQQLALTPQMRASTGAEMLREESRAARVCGCGERRWGGKGWRL